MVCSICHMTKKSHSINYIPLSHHDPSWYPMKSLYFQTHPGLFRSIQFWSIPIPTATSGLRFRRQATQPGKMSPEQSQQVGLKMAIASSLLYMFFIGKMCFFNMLKTTTTTIGVHTLCSDKPIWSCTRVSPLIGLFPVTFCLKPVDIRGVLPNFQQVESLMVGAKPGMSRASKDRQMGFKCLILGWKLQNWKRQGQSNLPGGLKHPE